MRVNGKLITMEQFPRMMPEAGRQTMHKIVQAAELRGRRIP